MKNRLLVMNGPRIFQIEEGGMWRNEKVDKAGLLKPGIYNLYLAGSADKSQIYQGAVVYADKEAVYQQVGKQFIRHARQDFDKVPDLGSASSIHYEQGSALASAVVAAQKPGESGRPRRAR
jgi:hypothetical protein